ncbi:MAG: fused MFS/spermidine synthase [Geitlerinemataceae cyanobacterium]
MSPLLILFSSTLFLSAFLLFWVQLMVAKMLLPVLGGTPSIWNTCLFFFQATLLLGYGYSHLTTRWWGVRRHAIVHSILLFLPIAFLPIALNRSQISLNSTQPIPALLILLVLGVGVPFFVISTTAPLVQKWFADTPHPDRDDPYFLYSASNLGSLLGVLSYPLVIEPNFSLTQQSWLWSISYGLLVFLTLGCALFLWKSGIDRSSLSNSDRLNLDNIEAISPTRKQKLQWTLLSFLPSSLLLGVTTYITTDIASIPLLWAVPLSIYLLTFILTFSRQSFRLNSTLIGMIPLFLVAAIALATTNVILPVWILLLAHWGGLFLVGCALHGELANLRPHPQYLTEFYFWISLGGVLGGLFNSIAAPWIFPTLLEYPLTIGLSLLILRDPSQQTSSSNLEIENLDEVYQQVKQAQKSNPDIVASDWIATNILPQYAAKNKPKQRTLFSLTLPIGLGLLLGQLLLGFQFKLLNNTGMGWILTMALFITMGYAFSLYPWRWLVGFILVICLNQYSLPFSRVIYTDRSFFGVNQVLYDAEENYHAFIHGTTLHGKQSLDPQRQNEPLTYFAKTGPVGQLFQSLNTAQRFPRVGIMGLGIGTLAAYTQPGQEWTFYEIDPTVEKIASDSEYFTFLQNAKAPVSIVLGDGRLSIAKVPDYFYNLIVMDAFSSDSIPVHLITREAIELYLKKLSPQGLLVLNITNRYIDLVPVIQSLAHDRQLLALSQWEKTISAEDKALGKTPSHWVVLARDRQDFGSLVNDPKWQFLPDTSSTPVWTDDFSNLFRSLRVFKTR